MNEAPPPRGRRFPSEASSRNQPIRVLGVRARTPARVLIVAGVFGDGPDCSRSVLRRVGR